MQHEVPPTKVAIVANVMTPYRLHLHRRIQNELPDVELHTILTHTKPNQPWTMDWSGLENLVVIPNHGNARFSAVSQWRAARAIERYIVDEGIHRVIINGYNDLTRLLLFARLPSRTRQVFLRGDSNLASDATRPLWRRLIKRPLIRWITRRSNGVFHMGVLGRRYYEHYAYPGTALHDMPYDVDLEAFAFRPPHDPDKRHRAFLYVGRISPEKGVDELMSAFLSISPDYPKWRLILAGDGPDRERLETSVPPDLPDRIEWLGFVEHSSLPDVFAKADVFVLPSRYEPWGIVVTEALSCGLPVIASDVVGSAAELARKEEHAVILVPPGKEDLANALRAAAASDLTRGAGARSAVERWHSRSDPLVGLARGLKLMSPEAEVSQASGDDQPYKHPHPSKRQEGRLP